MTRPQAPLGFTPWASHRRVSEPDGAGGLHSIGTLVLVEEFLNFNSFMIKTSVEGLHTGLSCVALEVGQFGLGCPLTPPLPRELV